MTAKITEFTVGSLGAIPPGEGRISPLSEKRWPFSELGQVRYLPFRQNAPIVGALWRTVSWEEQQ